MISPRYFLQLGHGALTRVLPRFFFDSKCFDRHTRQNTCLHETEQIYKIVIHTEEKYKIIKNI